MRQIQAEVAEGRLPAGSLVDGVMILIAGALLVTPGILTDSFGFLCLVPAFRSAAKRMLLRRLEKAVLEKRVHVSMDFGEGPDEQPGSMPQDVIDAEWRHPKP